MVDEAGLEPTMPLRRKIYSLLGLPIFLHIHLVIAQFTILFLPDVNSL